MSCYSRDILDEHSMHVFEQYQAIACLEYSRRRECRWRESSWHQNDSKVIRHFSSKNHLTWYPLLYLSFEPLEKDRSLGATWHTFESDLQLLFYALTVARLRLLQLHHELSVETNDSGPPLMLLETGEYTCGTNIPRSSTFFSSGVKLFYGLSVQATKTRLYARGDCLAEFYSSRTAT
jgi:hypothetical protein